MHKSKNRIVILTAGKVGSLTIKSSLENNPSLRDYHIYHGHDSKKYDSYWHDMSLASYFTKNRNLDNWHFILGIRNPIECYISSWYELHKEKGDFPIDEYQNAGAANWWLEFLDHEYKKNFNIDLYQYDFNISRGYSVYKPSENVSVLVYKLNSLTKVFSKATYDLLGVRHVRMINKNFTSNKSKRISKSYERAKEDYSIEEKYLKNILKHKYMKHFFSKKELKDISIRWKKK